MNRGAEWLGSRVISAQKANTTNAFSLDSSSSSSGKGQAAGLALSTANLFTAVQPGASLFGLQESNPVDTSVAYKGPFSDYGTANDPMVGSKIGGVNVFGGGLALYATNKVIVGGVGVSGDTSCTDHDVAWRVRNNSGLDHLLGVGGVSGDANHPDNIIYDIVANRDGTDGTGQNPAGSGGVGTSPSGFGHPKCLAAEMATGELFSVASGDDLGNSARAIEIYSVLAKGVTSRTSPDRESKYSLVDRRKHG
jgi:hypothetical protein